MWVSSSSSPSRNRPGVPNADARRLAWYLEVEGESGVAEVDGAELHVLEVEGRLGGVEGEVDDEHDEADEGEEREDAGGDGATAAAEDPVAVVLLLAHGGETDDDLPLLRCWTGLGWELSWLGCLASLGLCAHVGSGRKCGASGSGLLITPAGTLIKTTSRRRGGGMVRCVF